MYPRKTRGSRHCQSIRFPDLICSELEKTLSISIVNYGPVRIRATCRNVETPENVTKEHETLSAPRPLQKSNYTGNQKVKTAVYFPAARNDRIVVELLDRFESWPN